MQLPGGQAGSAGHPQRVWRHLPAANSMKLGHSPKTTVLGLAWWFNGTRGKAVGDSRPRVVEEMDPGVWLDLERSKGRKELISQAKTKGQSD